MVCLTQSAQYSVYYCVDCSVCFTVICASRAPLVAEVTTCQQVLVLYGSLPVSITSMLFIATK